jgi:radical SAM protein with 4Fe4S-binding SPASM domain
LDEKNILEWFISRDGLSNQKRDCDYCLAPFWHLQVTASGNVHYCVDFDDFSAGNIKNDDVMDIFENEISEKFRQEIFKGKNPMCKRCPWRFNTRYTIDDKRKDVR